MATLYTLAYPLLSDADAAAIESIRREHDPQRGVVPAHFTLAFGCGAVPGGAYTEHVQTVSRTMPAVSFACRYAMLNVESRTGLAYVYLVPDGGYSGLSRLHDALYRGPLAEHLNLDIPFVPHITLGVLRDKADAKRLCDELNARGIAISGEVNALSVAALEAGKIRDLNTFPLIGQTPSPSL
ncbi:MAG TPA: 2'-5' RNA ligase family protein [Bordetella sp.]|uniref:2'-5' RNA ligase family protein n=1 Tax=Bordetella sp. TaxID=28081 RepID=UPI002ED01721